MERIDLQPGQEIILKPGETIVSLEDEDAGFYWTSGRGDVWEKVYAGDHEHAARVQARIWADKGYRGPFVVMVGFLADQPQPPAVGRHVLQYKVHLIKSLLTESIGSIQITE